MTLLLVRYGELALKSPPVRREFERSLERNILEQFRAAGRTCRLRADHGHLYVESDAPDEAARLVRRVFGVTSVSVVEEVPSDRDRIKARITEWAGPLLADGASFAIRARRTGGTHPFTSQELARELGGHVLATWPDRHLTVDLDRPAVEISVEVRGPRTYLYSDRLRGPGGFPVGVAGHVVAFVDGRRGALGAYLMMKRGCRITLLATDESRSLAEGVLRRFDPRCPVRVLGSGSEAHDAIRSAVAETHADGVVLPLTVEQFPDARDRWGETVVLSPAVALSEEEVDRRWREVQELSGT